MKNLSILLFLALSISAYSQEPCSFDAVNKKVEITQTEKVIQQFLNSTRLNKASTHDTLTIPVVVHVIHNGGNENISEAQIESQIQILNEDFGKMTGTNGEGLGVDTRLRFCLAKIDPNGNCANGIVRLKSDLTIHDAGERAMLKQLSFWDNKKYLNFYVVRTITNGSGGYSSFPGGPDDADGIVVRANLFGNIGTAGSGLGRTATHEIGHWSGVYHTFQNGCGTDTCTDGDYVCDTPPVEEPSYTCDSINTCSNDIPNRKNMVENYMDYTPDECQSTFTSGQAARMHATMDTIRTQIWTQENLVATGCDAGYSPPFVCPVVADFVTLSTNICDGNSIYFMDRSLNSATSWKWTFEGGYPATSIEQNPTVSYNDIGVFKVKLVASDAQFTDSIERTAYITVASPGKGDWLSFGENFDLGVIPEPSVKIENPDSGITWVLDSNASTSGKYSIRIDNLTNEIYGSADDIVLPPLNLKVAHPDSDVVMTYNWAWAKTNETFSDEMSVLLSTDCGITYKRIFYRTDAALATGATQTSVYIPEASEWKSANINLQNYRDEEFVLIRIQNVPDGGNYLYIDDIYVGDGTKARTSIDNSANLHLDISLYPNPTSNSASLTVNLLQISVAEISISDLQGRFITSFTKTIPSGSSNVLLNTELLPAGVFLVTAKIGEASKTLRLVKIDY
jgi:PKD repeat protein